MAGSDLVVRVSLMGNRNIIIPALHCMNGQNGWVGSLLRVTFCLKYRGRNVYIECVNCIVYHKSCNN